MTISAVVQNDNQGQQFRGVFHNVIEMEAVFDPPSVGSNGVEHESVAVQGAALGDMVIVSVDIDVQDLDVIAHVTAANVVTVGMHNATPGAVDLGSCNIHIIVLQMNHQHAT